MTTRADLTAPVDVLARLAEPQTRPNPFPWLHWLRDNDPVHLTSSGFYLLTRYDDVKAAFRSTGEALLSPDRDHLLEQYPGALRHPSLAMFLDSLAMQNGANHDRLRGLVSQVFAPRHVSGLRETIEQSTRRLLDAMSEPLRDGEAVDVHENLSVPLATDVLVRLTGVPESDAKWLARTSMGIYPVVIPLMQNTVNSHEAMVATADARTVELEEYLVDLFEQRRRTPGDDLVSRLVALHDKNQDELSHGELIAMMWLLWLGGVETPAGGVDHGVAALLRHPEHHAWLRGGDDQVAAFTEEALRLYGSSLHAGIVRIATRDYEVCGVTIPKGADVRPSTAAANRDPSVFADPDRFDPSRDHRATMSFGHGMRYCLGAFLGRAEMNHSLPLVHARFPDLVAAGEPTWHDLVATRLIRRLPVALGSY